MATCLRPMNCIRLVENGIVDHHNFFWYTLPPCPHTLFHFTTYIPDTPPLHFTTSLDITPPLYHFSLSIPHSLCILTLLVFLNHLPQLLSLLFLPFLHDMTHFLTSLIPVHAPVTVYFYFYHIPFSFSHYYCTPSHSSAALLFCFFSPLLQNLTPFHSHSLVVPATSEPHSLSHSLVPPSAFPLSPLRAPSSVPFS